MGPTTNHNKTICGIKNWLPVVTVVIFALLYALISFVNHINFRTYGLDLGLYTHAMYQYVQGQMADCGMFLWPKDNMLLLADHFDLYLILFAPLTLLFGNYTLLIVQMVALLLGGVGVYCLLRSYTGNGNVRGIGVDFVPWLGMVSYLSFFGVWHALSFDYHSNVVAVNLIPWMILALRKGRGLWSFVAVAAMCVSKESTALWLVFVLAALLFDFRNNMTAKRWLLVNLLFCILYFVLVSMVVMPNLGGESPGFWRYSHMGDSMSDLVVYMVAHPLESVRIFFTNFRNDPDNNGLKLGFFLCCAASGMLLCLRKPNYLLMMIPPLLLKMMSADAGFWGVGMHYNIEFAPVLVIGSFVALIESFQKRQRLMRAPWSLLLGAAVASLLTVSTTAYTLRSPQFRIRAEHARICEKEHYRQSQFDADYARNLINKIPSDASVCAATPFIPHLAEHQDVSIFPVMSYKADYLLVFDEHWSYYDDARAEMQIIFSDTASYKVVDTDGRLYLIARNCR